MRTIEDVATENNLLSLTNKHQQHQQHTTSSKQNSMVQVSEADAQRKSKMKSMIATKDDTAVTAGQ